MSLEVGNQGKNNGRDRKECGMSTATITWFNIQQNITVMQPKIIPFTMIVFYTKVKYIYEHVLSQNKMEL